jgi:hypothetical protein
VFAEGRDGQGWRSRDRERQREKKSTQVHHIALDRREGRKVMSVMGNLQLSLVMST